MIDSSIDKSQIDQIDIYSLCSSRSIIYTYTYNNGRRIKESIRSEERAGKLSSTFLKVS